MPATSDTNAITRIELEHGLRTLGLCTGDVVEVHSSLSSFGRVEGGAAAVVDALMNVIGETGALVMSAYPLSKPLPLSDAEKARGIRAKVRLYGEDYTGPTGMGVIADEFRQRPGVVLGHGQHRVCAWGRDAHKHSAGYAYLLAVNGKALLLGVGIGRCSSMHQAEQVGIPPEIEAYSRVPEDIRRDYSEDHYIVCGSAPEDGWGKVAAEAEARGMIRRCQIGQAPCQLFYARQVVDIYEQALRTDPWGLFGVKRPS